MIINTVMMNGRLGADAETKDVNGKTLTSFRMGVYQGKGKDSMWVTVSAWEKTGEYCQGITKGQEVLVEGSLSSREYTNKDGAVITSIEIRASRVHQLQKSEKSIASASVEDVPF